MVFGTFDVIHPGHLYFLEKAKEKGDYLVVVVARDFTVKKLKGSFPVNNESKRLKEVSEIKSVDKAVLGSEKDELKVVEENKPDIICLGYDQSFFTENLEERLAQRGINAEVVRLDAYKSEKYKSSKLKA